MQDRYAGDIGDFVKLGLLRALASNHRLGVAWYRFPDESHNKDGRHIDYLERPERYRVHDPELFDHLRQVVLEARTIDSLLRVLPSSTSSAESLDVTHVPVRQRRDWRTAWFSRVLENLETCDLVFADPDNGIVGDEDWRKGRSKFGKQMPLGEVQALSQGRCAVIYHHNTRRAGGHDSEVDYWLGQIGAPALAVRATAYSPRTFFVINPTPDIEKSVYLFCDQWRDMRVRLHVGD